jgi:hypothetical protein
MWTNTAPTVHLQHQLNSDFSGYQDPFIQIGILNTQTSGRTGKKWTKIAERNGAHALFPEALEMGIDLPCYRISGNNYPFVLYVLPAAIVRSRMRLVSCSKHNSTNSVLDKLTIPQLLTKFPSFMDLGRFITVPATGPCL